MIDFTKQYWQSTLLAVVGLVLLYGALELWVRHSIAIRGFSYIRVHPDRFPYYSLVDSYNDGEITIRNSRRERLPRPPRRYQVAFVGDSVTFGIGVSDKDLFTELLQAKQSLYNVYNYGVPGYGLPEVAAVIDQITKTHQFDLIVYLFNFNDLFPTMPGTLSLLQRPKYRFASLDEFQGLYGQLKLFTKDHFKAIFAVPYFAETGLHQISQLLATRKPKRSGDCYEDHRSLLESEKYRKFYGIVGDMYANARIQQRLQEMFTHMKSKVENAGGRLLVLLHPDLYFFEHPSSPIYDMEKTLIATGINYVNLYFFFEPQYRNCGQYYDATHPSSQSHRSLSDLLVRPLALSLKMSLLPRVSERPGPP